MGKKTTIVEEARSAFKAAKKACVELEKGSLFKLSSQLKKAIIRLDKETKKTKPDKQALQACIVKIDACLEKTGCEIVYDIKTKLPPMKERFL